MIVRVLVKKTLAFMRIDDTEILEAGLPTIPTLILHQATSHKSFALFMTIGRPEEIHMGQ